jgi:hypothetical protein
MGQQVVTVGREVRWNNNGCEVIRIVDGQLSEVVAVSEPSFPFSS